jgi:purine-binding chemotaxis protein CheW
MAERDERDILRKRAEVLSEPEGWSDATDQQGEEYIGFRIVRQAYCIEKKYVREVIRLRDTTVIPGIPEYFPGIIHVRGRLVVLLNLLNFLGIPVAGIVEHKEVIIVKRDHNEIGLMTDAVTGSLRVPARDMSKPSSGLKFQRYIKGIVKDGMIVLDMEEIFADKRLTIND